MLNQISIYAENRRGAMRDITNILARENINILGSVMIGGAEYGTIRMIVSDPEGCLMTLKDQGYICKLTKVLGVEVEDQVGNLNRLLSALYESYINVDYVYLSYNRESGMPIMVFHVEDPAEVEDCLKRKGFVSL